LSNVKRFCKSFLPNNKDPHQAHPKAKRHSALDAESVVAWQDIKQEFQFLLLKFQTINVCNERRDKYSSNEH